jgi:D-inositol-3-phosphate glycosyltransferase
MHKSGNFIIRVYGIVINENNEVLLTDEYQLNMKMTKFPGGGLHFGEGPLDCLRREFREECNGQEIENIRHLYTTDFFQKAFFYEGGQLISIYYLADLKYPLKFKVSEKAFDFEKQENGSQSFRWMKINDIKEEDISFPIDKFVVHKLKKNILNKIIIIGSAYPYRGGLAAYNERLAREFISEGNDVSIETFSLQYPGIFFPGKTQFRNGEPPENIQIRRSINSVNPLNWLKIGIKIKKEKPDLVIIKYWLPFMAPCFGTIAGQIKKNKHTKIICIADNITPHEKKPGDKLLTRYFLKRIDGLVAQSKNVLDDVHSYNLNIPVKLSPHPVFDNFGEGLKREEALDLLKLDHGPRYILFFGFIRDYKGLDILLKALSDQRITRLNIKLIVAGEFYTDPQPYLNIIEDLKLKEKVILKTNFIADNEVKIFFSCADLVVQPYKHATQSGVTQIGYHFNKTMLVTNVGGLPEMIPNNVVGYVVEPDEKHIADAIYDFFSKDKKNIFEKNIKEVKKKFLWSAMTNAISEIQKISIKNDNKK